MKFSVVYSKKDKAALNIIENLKNHFLPQMTLLELKKDSIYSENIDETEESLKNSEFIIFASRHESREKVKTLSLHAPGNWRNADYGGKPSKLAKTSALALKFLFQRLNENAKNNPDYNITLEATHHGPLINKPCCFIEIGSTEEEWTDKSAGEIIAKTIADFQNFKKESGLKIALGIGGPHYCPNFNKFQLSKESKIAIGHVIPSYILPINEAMILEAIEKTQEHIDLVLLDWKGLGNLESKSKTLETIKKLGLESERTETLEK